MTKISLSNSDNKAFCVAGDIIMAAIISALIYFTRNSLALLIGAIVLSAFVLLLLALYTIVNFNSYLIIDNNNRKITLVQMRETDFDCANVKSITTQPTQIGNRATRLLNFLDENNESLFKITTLISSNEGAKVELIAIQLSEILQINFIPTVEKYKYDKQARKERDAKLAQIAAEEKRERKAKKYAKKHGLPYNPPSKEKPSEELPSAVIQEPDVNYDELDDEKIDNQNSK